MDRPQAHESRIIIWVFLSFYLIIVLRNAWMGDDAFITLRVVDNFINGYGLCWNISERVQAFTHPLWLLVITPFYALTREAYFTVIALSVLLSAAAVVVYGFRMVRTVAVACLGITILSLSDAFIDYSTSGLESPLTYLLLAIFLTLFFACKPGLRSFALLAFLTSMATLTRPDIILLYLPMLVYAFWQVRGLAAVKGLIVGFTPLIMWTAFSVAYYGFPFSNTAYAKMQTGVPPGLFMQQGVCYVLNSLRVDPLTMMTILAALVMSGVKRKAKPIALSLGILLTILYTIRIGGCFMSGRFFAAPLFASVFVLACLFRNVADRYVIGAGIVFVALGLISPYSPVYSRVDDGASIESSYLGNYIVDERVWYNITSGLLNYQREKEIWPSIDWAYSGMKARRSGEKVIVNTAVGNLGFRAGPHVYIIDRNGLTDPLLSRLPIPEADYKKPGHYGRRLPFGYKQSVVSGNNVIRDPHIARYYDIIRLITQGPIASPARWKEIIKINLGWYDYLIEDYARPKLQSVPLSDLQTPVTAGTYWNHPGNIILDTAGVRVELGRVYHARQFEFCRDNNDDYLIRFYLDDTCIDSAYVPQYNIQGGGMSISMVATPAAAVDRGYNRMEIFPIGPDRLNSIGHIIFE